MQIVPAILPHSFEEIIEKCSRVEGIATNVQIDLCDGVFGREKTWLPVGTETLPEGFSYEFDIMLDDWRESVLHCLTLGATSIVVHADVFQDEDISTVISMVAPVSASLGIAVSNDKGLDFHADMIRKAHTLYPHIYIQVMGIDKIGEQGQFFDERTPERVKQLKQQFGSMPLQVDGGMTMESAKLVAAAGADSIIVGSYIFGGEDAGGAMERLTVVCGV